MCGERGKESIALSGMPKSENQTVWREFDQKKMEDDGVKSG